MQRNTWSKYGWTGAVVFLIVGIATPAAAQRSYDGSGNNLANPSWGSVGARLLRLAPADYGDGVATLGTHGRDSARAISNAVCRQDGLVFNQQSLSAFVFQWGQFLDHDIDLTEAAHPTEAAAILVPSGDAFFVPGSTIPFERSVFDPASGTSDQNPREQINQISAYIDASNVYGSSASRADALRTHQHGKLATSTHDLLPFNTMGLPNAGGPDPGLYVAGDVRANEQVGLTAMHTLFVREHNRLADELRAAHGDWSDEQIYQKARALVGAQMQVVTYREFLPAILGPGALSSYAGYDAGVEAGIFNEFSTAAFRFGHSMLSPVLFRSKNNGKAIPEGHLALREAFFTRNELDPDVGKGIEPLLRGLAAQLAQNVDVLVVEDVRSFLFGAPGAGGFDLAAANIQRGRDHGLASYNDTRAALGLAPRIAFSEISADPVVVARLQAAYDSVDDIDLWVGGIAEDHVPGAFVGETFFVILVQQFERLRDGDRFWYQNVFTGAELAELESTTLAAIIARNTKIKESELPANVFIQP